MKILMITQDFPPVQGGIQSYCYELAMALVNQGVELTVVCPYDSQAEDLKWPFKVHRLKSHTSLLFTKLMFFLPKFLKQNSFDHILLGQWQNAIGFGFSWPKQTKVHSMVHGRELLDGIFRGLTSKICSKYYKKFDSVIPNSHPVAELFQEVVPRFDSKKIKVIHPGVDPDKFHPSNKSLLRKELNLQDKRLLVSITRLVARKNIALVIETMPLILKEIPNAHYIVGGRGPELENLRKQVIQLKLEEHVSVLGAIPEDKIVEYFGVGDVFILPSSQSSKDVEGFGIVFLEAGACEVAVIGANTGGIRDAVLEGETGVLIQPINKDTLAQAVIKIIKDPKKAQLMGENSRQRILNELTWAKCGEAYSKHFKTF